MRKPAHHFSVLLLIAMLSMGFTGAGDAPWEHEKEANGITIYTRHVEDSKVKELKAVTVFNSNLSGLVALIMDIPEAKSYVYHCENAYVVRTEGDSVLTYYQDVSVQWPVSNRDVVIRYRVKQDKKTKVVTVESGNVNGMVPEFEGKVRIPKLRGLWRFVPQRNGTVHGEYTLFVDPGGNIPESVSNLFLVDGPYQTILRMKTLVLQSKYQSKKFSMIAN